MARDSWRLSGTRDNLKTSASRNVSRNMNTCISVKTCFNIVIYSNYMLSQVRNLTPRYFPATCARTRRKCRWRSSGRRRRSSCVASPAACLHLNLEATSRQFNAISAPTTLTLNCPEYTFISMELRRFFAPSHVRYISLFPFCSALNEFFYSRMCL